MYRSDLVCIRNESDTIEVFPPGHYYNGKTQSFNLWYRRDRTITRQAYDPTTLRTAFEQSVERHMMSDVPWGVLLSGGLDSSLVASVACRILKRQAQERGESCEPIEKVNLHSFCIGLVGSPDLKAAEQVASYLGTIHHSLTFSIEEGLDALRQVIYHLETFDTTTIRASTPMFLMSRRIKSMGIKMILSGEGSDEIFGGYLYFHKAPNKLEFENELIDKIATLYFYDCLRANKITSARGLELRVPFLD